MFELGECLVMQVNAEIVVTFEGTTEFGNPFMARQSYLMDEIMWGHQFTQIIHPPETDDTKYRIDFSRYRIRALHSFGLLVQHAAACCC